MSAAWTTINKLSRSKQAAPGYQIADAIDVQEAGLHDDIQAATQKAQLDSAIEDNFKARLSDEPSLKSERIQYTAFQGTLTLKGSVRNRKERQQAEDLARKVPQVQHVVNQLQVHPRQTIAGKFLTQVSLARS